LMPLFQNPTNDSPWTIRKNYGKGSCPIVEKLYEEELFLTLYHAPNSTIDDCGDVRNAFFKVWEYREEIKRSSESYTRDYKYERG